MELEGCIATAVDTSGKQVKAVRLKDQPSQRIGNLRKPRPRGNIIDRNKMPDEGSTGWYKLVLSIS